MPEDPGLSAFIGPSTRLSPRRGQAVADARRSRGMRPPVDQPLASRRCNVSVSTLSLMPPIAARSSRRRRGPARRAASTTGSQVWANRSVGRGVRAVPPREAVAGRDAVLLAVSWDGVEETLRGRPRLRHPHVSR